MNYVGKSQPIHDAGGKVTGHTKYTADLELVNMAHVAMVYSTIPHGYVRAVHVEAAMQIPGVLGVFHCFNTTEKTYNRYRSRHNQETLPGEERIFEEHVRFVGDRVAAVAAVDIRTARRAARLIQIEYEELPAALTVPEALTGKNLTGDEKVVPGGYHLQVGTKIPVQEDWICVETESSMERLTHGAMEPHVCVADYDPMEEKLTIISPNQAIYGIRTVVADLLEMPYAKVRVVKATMGGSFGAKQEWELEPVAACVAKALKRPVKLVFTRGEVMVSTVVRAPITAKARSYFDLQGHLQALYIEATLDAGAYVSNSNDYIAVMSGKFFRTYQCPYVEFCGTVVRTNTPVSGAYRSWGAAESAIVVEHNLNQAAKVLGMDPIVLREKNILHPGDMDRKMKLSVGEVRIQECLDLGRKKFHWKQKQIDDCEYNKTNFRRRRGVGMACAGHGNTYYPRLGDFGQAGLRMAEDGSLTASVTLHDHGCGTVTAMKMILAEEMGVAPDRIQLGEGDTEHTPYDMGCFSSRTTFVVGRAVYDCAVKLKEQLLQDAAAMYGLDRIDLYIQEGCICSRKDASIQYTYGQVAGDSMTKLRKEESVFVCYQNETNPGVSGTHFAHVEVDTYTGAVRVLDYLAVHDIGQAINREMCKGQIQGAAIMGCGAALGEKITVNREGQAVHSLKSYHMLNCPSAPEVQVELIEDAQTEGAFGVKSIGEVAYAPTAACVCAAVNNALDSSLGMLPLDPECIVEWTAREDKNDA